uniref:Ala_racemase_N domain-containing protein n=1 Tax=Ascaris lumbricoides TaxID=6252 RepID=A0A0M3IKL2_ASCLU
MAHCVSGITIHFAAAREHTYTKLKTFHYVRKMPPDVIYIKQGRLHQVDYAVEAMKQGSATVGLHFIALAASFHCNIEVFFLAEIPPEVD